MAMRKYLARLMQRMIGLLEWLLAGVRRELDRLASPTPVREGKSRPDWVGASDQSPPADWLTHATPLPPADWVQKVAKSAPHLLKNVDQRYVRSVLNAAPPVPLHPQQPTARLESRPPRVFEQVDPVVSRPAADERFHIVRPPPNGRTRALYRRTSLNRVPHSSISPTHPYSPLTSPLTPPTAANPPIHRSPSEQRHIRRVTRADIVEGTPLQERSTGRPEPPPTHPYLPLILRDAAPHVVETGADAPPSPHLAEVTVEAAPPPRAVENSHRIATRPRAAADRYAGDAACRRDRAAHARTTRIEPASRRAADPQRPGNRSGAGHRRTLGVAAGTRSRSG